MSKIIKSSRVIDKGKLLPSKEESLNPAHKDESEEIISKAIEKAKVLSDNIIGEAKTKSKQIIGEVNKERERLRLEIKEESRTRMEEAKNLGFEEGLREGKKSGYEEGYEVGYGEGKSEADKLINEAISLKKSYISMKENIYKELEPKMVELVIGVYEKIIGEKVKEKDFILDLINSGISKLDPTDNLTIIVSKEDYQLVLDNKNIILAHGSFINELEIKYDINFQEGDCVFEMDKGSIDLSVEGQLNEVKKTIMKILNNE